MKKMLMQILYVPAVLAAVAMQSAHAQSGWELCVFDNGLTDIESVEDQAKDALKKLF